VAAAVAGEDEVIVHEKEVVGRTPQRLTRPHPGQARIREVDELERGDENEFVYPHLGGPFVYPPVVIDGQSHKPAARTRLLR
jgi:hypothetical protein